jgi:hypothetical protein
MRAVPLVKPTLLFHAHRRPSASAHLLLTKDTTRMGQETSDFGRTFGHAYSYPTISAGLSSHCGRGSGR